MNYQTSIIKPESVRSLLALAGKKPEIPEFGPIRISGIIRESLSTPQIKLLVNGDVLALSANAGFDTRTRQFHASLSAQADLARIMINKKWAGLIYLLRQKGKKPMAGSISSNFAIYVDSLGFNDYLYQDITMDGRLPVILSGCLFYPVIQLNHQPWNRVFI